jgi:hypothetical protein
MKRNYKRMNKKEYIKALKETLPPLHRLVTKTAIDSYVQEIVKGVREAAEKTAPQTDIIPHSREGWTDECKEVLMETKRLRRLHSQQGTEDSWEAYRAARNHKTRTIRKALTKMHRHRVEEAAESPEKLWKLANWARMRGNEAPRITPAIQHPTIHHEIMEPEDKADLFQELFSLPHQRRI